MFAHGAVLHLGNVPAEGSVQGREVAVWTATPIVQNHVATLRWSVSTIVGCSHSDNAEGQCVLAGGAIQFTLWKIVITVWTWCCRLVFLILVGFAAVCLSRYVVSNSPDYLLDLLLVSRLQLVAVLRPHKDACKLVG